MKNGKIFYGKMKQCYCKSFIKHQKDLFEKVYGNC